MSRLIYKQGNYRIIEHQDDTCDLETLKGDCYNVELNESDILTKEMILDQERKFEMQVEVEGVFGYELQIWDGAVDAGWTHVDSCWGFIGMYNEDDNNHYIIDELKSQI